MIWIIQPSPAFDVRTYRMISTYRARIEDGRRLETSPERRRRVEVNRSRIEERRDSETIPQRDRRVEQERKRIADHRSGQSSRQRDEGLTARRTLRQQSRPRLYNAAFNYDPLRNYTNDLIRPVNLGPMNLACPKCGALKWRCETPGLCCGNGSVELPLFRDPPEALERLFGGTDENSEHFLQNITQYNCAFQMTSFGANIIHEGGFMPTFKVQGQVYHQMGSLLPPSANEPPKFLQIYFVNDLSAQSQMRQSLCTSTQLPLINYIQAFLHDNNPYVRDFKCVLDDPPHCEYKIVIDADKRPRFDHPGRYNAPQCDEVAIILAGDPHGKRDIVVKTRDGGLQFVDSRHRSYDSLQYPLLFPYGDDGYHFNIPLKNLREAHNEGGNTSSRGRQYISCREFYCYHFMVRERSSNHLLQSRKLLHQFAVDVYAKEESERLAFIKTHQQKLRVDSFIHLQDAINNDVPARETGQLCILPSSFTGSPRYMHEKTQDALTYVKYYGRPDLFITFTCNPKWPEIERNRNRHDLIARVFHCKVKALMELFTKSQIFGEVRCHMNTYEWQKRGLPHTHILLWLNNKIHLNDVDKIISAELPDPEQDITLFNIVKFHMVHGPCGAVNPRSPCMADRRCTKGYPKRFVPETQSSADDGYPTYNGGCPDRYW